MSDNPLLFLPTPTIVERQKGSSGRPKEVSRPDFDSRQRTLSPKFNVLQQAIDAERMQLRAAVEGSSPELVLVLETVGRIEDFYKAVKRVDGLEWLFDIDQATEPDEEVFYRHDREKLIPGRLYLVMSNQQGLQQLLSLWQFFVENQPQPRFTHGLAKWRSVFNQLRDVRPWGPEDRLRDTGLFEVWQERVEAGEEDIEIEVELWFKQDETRRALAEGQVQNFLQEVDGQLLAQIELSDIDYHAMLVSLPITSVERLFAYDVRLVRAQEVMLIRPHGQFEVIIEENQEADESQVFENPTNIADRSPVVALLDGLPIENHVALRNKVLVDDPDDLSANYPSNYRIHGSAMASLIINGNLDDNEESISAPLYVRPILAPDFQAYDIKEAVPRNVFLVDLIHRAVKRIFDGDDEFAPIPTIRVINLSIGDPTRPLDLNISPLARLLDWLAWKYKVLFIVSAGNHPRLELPFSENALTQISRDEAQLHSRVLRTLSDSTTSRRLLSPSESINSITVGALHSDSSDYQKILGQLDLLPEGCVSPINALGPGYSRSVKPEIFFPGGRQIHRRHPIGPNNVSLVTPINSIRAPGIKVAMPGVGPADLNKVGYSRGTSNATALASRFAAFLYDEVNKLLSTENREPLGQGHMITLLKTLMVHGASWEKLRPIFETLGFTDKKLLARLIGYGSVDQDKAMSCSDQQATLIAWNDLRDGEAHRYALPLPRSLSGVRGRRKLTVTLSWLSPINPKHHAYKRALLWVKPYGDAKTDRNGEELLRISRVDVDNPMAQRGTVQHEIFEGEQATAYGVEDHVLVQVNCRAFAGTLQPAIPYGLAVTLEVASELNLPIYQEIAERIRPLIGVLIDN